MQRPVLFVWFVLLLAFSSTDSLCAQAVRGHLIDDSNQAPVGGATITLLIDGGRHTQVLTEGDGYFFIELDAGGTFRLEAERIGYRNTTSQPFQVEPTDTLTVDFMVLPDAVLLNPIVVTARSNRGRDAFYRRMEDWHQGIFVTPAMVDSIHPRHPAEVLRKQPDVWLSWTWGHNPETGAAGPIPNIHTYRGRTGCVTYMIDGRPIWRPSWATGPAWLDWPLNTLGGEEIVAVEVYRSLSEVPEELRNYTEEIYDGQPLPDLPSITGGQRVQLGEIPEICGIINFWTRVGW